MGLMEMSSVGTVETYDPDTYSMISQASSMLTIGDSIPAQIVRKTARKGYSINIMLVGPPEMNKSTLMSALFGKTLNMSYGDQPPTDALENGDSPSPVSPSKIRARSSIQQKKHLQLDLLNPPVSIARKTFEIEEKRVKLRLTLAESENYGEAISLKGTYKPLVDYIDAQFADFFRREFSHNRKLINDKMVHCLFFFISPFGHGLSEFDLQFLEAVHNRVNIIPVIARAEALTPAERNAFKRRVREDLRQRNISVYQMGSPDMDDPDDLKKVYKDIQDAMPFAISSMTLKQDSTAEERCLDWGRIDPYNLDHSDFLLLKTMLNMQIPDLCEITHEVFYEQYRLSMLDKDISSMALGQSRLKRLADDEEETQLIRRASLYK